MIKDHCLNPNDHYVIDNDPFTKILVKLVVGKTYSTDFTRSFLSFCHSFFPFSSICLVIHHELNLNTYKIIVKLLISVDVTRKPLKV